MFSQVLTGGAESMIMTLYRNIDKEKVQFDFVVNQNNESYNFEAEILSMGGNIYRIPRFNIINIFSYLRKWNNLLDSHNDYKIIHAHHTSPAFIYLLTVSYIS
jgi:hypothetical protein